MEQALAADVARANGASGALLGIPIGVKNLYDTYDMATTNGSLTFAGFRPAKDAFQIARLREAGAVILGKTALEEYATSGNYSNDAVGPGVERVQPVQVGDRVERRLGDRGGGEPVRRGDGLADR